MRFGFLTDKTAFEFSRFKIVPVPEIEDILKIFYESENVSQGWFYGIQEELKKSSKEIEYFDNCGPRVYSSFFRMKSTHQITSDAHVDDDHLRFLILGYGFLQGLYLTPENYSYLGRTAYELGKLNALLLSVSGNDHVNGMECINKFYNDSNIEQWKQMFACIHWYLIGQGYQFGWDKFDAQYKVLDGIFRLSGIKSGNHADRPIELAKKYNLKLPSWAELNTTGRQSKLSKQRNELVHEATYGGHPIGYSYPVENYNLEFRAFNTKLIASALGIDTPYLEAEPNNRVIYGWSIRT